MATRKITDPFYNSVAWKRARTLAKQHYGYRCARCGEVFTGPGQLVVNHKVQLKDLAHDDVRRYSLDNLEVLCRQDDGRHPVTNSAGHVVRGTKHGAPVVTKRINLNGLPDDWQ